MCSPDGMTVRTVRTISTVKTVGRLLTVVYSKVGASEGTGSGVDPMMTTKKPLIDLMAADMEAWN
jgi:hypothetical protein